MVFVSRDGQISDREWDSFSPLKRIAATQIGIMSLKDTSLGLTDDLLDGITLRRPDVPAHWINENVVHQAISLSERIADTKYFLGPQVVATRDDVRQLSHILVAEPDCLFLVTTELGKIRNKAVVHKGEVRRAHLTLDNFSGVTRVLYSAASGQSYRLYLDGEQLKTESGNIDFPFMAVSQPAKGRTAKEPSKFGLLAYKCRDTGKLYYRNFGSDGAIGPETLLVAPEVVGGLDFAIHEDTVLFHIDAVIEGKLVPMVAKSTDRGVTIPEFQPIDLSGFQPDAVLPTSAPVARDYHGNFHIPIAALKDDQQHLLDVHDDHVVETMVLKGKGFGYALLVFPKKAMPMDFRGVGDGNTDGIGIIATTIVDGKLMITNSQCGGFKYPKERCVNFEMPQMFAFRATECCYTRAQAANMVSMDYVFIEANHDGDPLSSTLWLETWDMPLPLPKIEATSKGRTVEVSIVRDAWFEEGKTTFSISDPTVSIVSVKFIDERRALLKCDKANLKGKTVNFEMKNFYYWHAGDTVIG
ncbi:hypothetical protein [Agrobacterium tumefaciens]|uniref:hypothetical protein n=1 Tax=Agrobacterium tumefaciens TaxID=358 RepID=UPI001AE328C3|nr:hypothetical protein [Agrobacterium tumefaciens]MBP2534875.1 hypothetical protein [Agrobacterium tumefaciens]